LLFPSTTKKVEFGSTTTAVADESIVSGAGEAIELEAKVKKDTPKNEEKG
jgi:hypothetical protein